MLTGMVRSKSQSMLPSQTKRKAQKLMAGKLVGRNKNAPERRMDSGLLAEAVSHNPSVVSWIALMSLAAHRSILSMKFPVIFDDN